METQIERDFYRDKILQLDKPITEKILRKYRSPWQFLRPLFWRLFGFVARHLTTKGSGLENLPQRGPFIIASNHSSSLDFGVVAWLLPPQIRKHIYVMAWEGFFKFPFFYVGWGIKIATNCFAMRGEGNYFKGLREAAQLLRLGRVVYFFPEGNRTQNGRLLPFKYGLGFLATELGVPVVPVYIKGAFEALRPGTIFLKKIPVRIYFGKPISSKKPSDTSGLFQAELYQEFSNKIRAEIFKLQQQTPLLESKSS
jgi:1-acyl-sn-glycerol-3-phosphate acyltransferase